MSGLMFDEQSMIEGNIFKYEQRLQSHMNKYIENGAMLTTWIQINDNASTVDRGIQNIDILVGPNSPLRFNKILDYPVYGFGQANPNNNEESNIEDITVEGEITILPSTIEPHQYDFFMINHLKMTALFQVTEVQYDSMKTNGYYKIKYRLFSTSNDTIDDLNKQCISTYHTDMNAIGSEINPIIKEEDFIKIRRIKQMVNKMISAYKALFYNDIHNCYLYFDNDSRDYWFDYCGNEFISKHSIMNMANSSTVIMTSNKLVDNQFPLYYNNSIYNWLELSAPSNKLQRFNFKLVDATDYQLSSFHRIPFPIVKVMIPMSSKEVGINNRNYTYLSSNQMECLYNKEPQNEYEKLLYKYINNYNEISIQDINLSIADAILASIDAFEIYVYTPIIIYIINQILRMN